MMRRALLASVLAATVGLGSAACSTGQSTPTHTEATQQESTQQSSTQQEPTQQEPTQQETTGQEPTQQESRRTESSPSGPASSPQYGSGHGLCFDMNSQLAADAIASLGRDSNGGSWRPAGASENPLADGCGLDWLKVDGDGFRDATYTSRVLVFTGGKFIGTVEPHELSYTEVTGSTSSSVTVEYRWLRDDDPFCCPSGGPTTVTASVSNGAIVRDGEFPPDA